jgi:hypothetical protein
MASREVRRAEENDVDIYLVAPKQVASDWREGSGNALNIKVF